MSKTSRLNGQELRGTFLFRAQHGKFNKMVESPHLSNLPTKCVANSTKVF